MNKLARLTCFRHLRWHPNARELRTFAGVMLIGFGVLGLLAAWQDGMASGRSLVLWAAGAALAAAGVTPGLGRFAYLLVYMLSSMAGYLISHIILVLLFYGLFTPLAWLLRAFRADPLSLRPAPGATQWRVVVNRHTADRYYRQF